jgi:hypothetical protein
MISTIQSGLPLLLLTKERSSRSIDAWVMRPRLGQLAELSAQKMARIPQDVVGRIVAEHKAHFSCHGLSPAHDDCTDIQHFPEPVARRQVRRPLASTAQDGQLLPEQEILRHHRSHTTGATELRGHDGQVRRGKQKASSCAGQRWSNVGRHATLPQSWIRRENWRFETQKVTRTIADIQCELYSDLRRR